MAVNPINTHEPAGANTRVYRTPVNPPPFRHLSFPVRVAVLALVGLALLSGSVFAHPPMDAIMTYNPDTGDLTVTVTHTVDDPATHYVKQVTVKQGDTVLVDKSYTSQPDRSSFTYRYNLPQLKGSSGEVRVNAQCSIIGSRSGALVLDGTGTPAQQSTAPGSPAATSPVTAVPEPTKSPVGAFAAITAIGLMVRFIRR